MDEAMDQVPDYQDSLQILQEQILIQTNALYVQPDSGEAVSMSLDSWQQQIIEADGGVNEKEPSPEDYGNSKLEAEEEQVNGDDSPDAADNDDESSYPYNETVAEENISAGFQEASKRKLEENTIQNDGNVDDSMRDGENSASVSDDGMEGPAPAKKPLLEINPRKLLPELEKLWKPVDDDPSDFTAWTFLLQYVDHENELSAARDAYNGFLARYPYCYGYWKKFADLEKRKSSGEDCYKVFRRGLTAIPLSVDLWLHYLNYAKATHEDIEYVRQQFQEAVNTVGLEFRSDKLWEHYLQFEKDNGDLRKVLAVYDQILATPTQSYAQHFHNLKEFINSNPPEDLLGEEEYLDLKVSVEELLSSSDDVENRDQLEMNAIREKLIERKSEIHKATEAQAQARWAFEEAIKRPYFHVKALEKGQLKMWKEYLDFEIEKGDDRRILILFERCLIACCLYEEYWIKYIKYLQSQPLKNVDRIRDVFQRACTVHHPGKPWVNLHWAAFEESQGNISKACEILEKLETLLPSSAHVRFRRINLERRQGHLQKCVELFEKYITDETNPATVAHVKIKFARFLVRFLSDYDKALQILEDAVDEDQASKNKILMALIDIGISRKPLNIDQIISTFDRALQSDLSSEQKLTFAHRKVEFLDDFGVDPSSILLAQEELQSISTEIAQNKAAADPSREEDAATAKFPKPPSGPHPHQYGSTPATQYQPPSSSLPPSAHHNGSMGQDYGGQYGQYQNWNYQQQPSAGYGYPPQQQQGWAQYGGYQG